MGRALFLFWSWMVYVRWILAYGKEDVGKQQHRVAQGRRGKGEEASSEKDIQVDHKDRNHIDRLEGFFTRTRTHTSLLFPLLGCHGIDRSYTSLSLSGPPVEILNIRRYHNRRCLIASVSQIILLLSTINKGVSRGREGLKSGPQTKLIVILGRNPCPWI